MYWNFVKTSFLLFADILDIQAKESTRNQLFKERDYFTGNFYLGFLLSLIQIQSRLRSKTYSKTNPNFNRSLKPQKNKWKLADEFSHFCFIFFNLEFFGGVVTFFKFLNSQKNFKPRKKKILTPKKK